MTLVSSSALAQVVHLPRVTVHFCLFHLLVAKAPCLLHYCALRDLSDSNQCRGGSSASGFAQGVDFGGRVEIVPCAFLFRADSPRKDSLVPATGF